MKKAKLDILSTLDKDEQIAYLIGLTDTLEAQNNALNTSFEGACTDNAELSKDNISLKKESLHWKAEYDKLVEQIKRMNARYFGASSEKISPYQISLFNDMEAAAVPEAEEPSADEVLPKKRKKKRSIDYSKFETVVIEHVLPIEDRKCLACETVMEKMGVEVKRVIKLIPARLVVEEHSRHVYGCVCCSKKNATDGTTPVQIIKATIPHFPLEKSCAHPSLLAHIIHQKYSLAQPLYRIADDMKNSCGLTLSRQTLASWVIRSYERWLALIYALMREKLLERDAMHIDESPVQVLKEPGREPKSKSYMWLFAGIAAEKPLYIFEYNPSRSRAVVAGFLQDWSGTIITDGYAAYEKLGQDITRISCLVHIRRKYTDVIKGLDKEKLKSVPGLVSLKALKMIDEIFHIDNTFNDMDAFTRYSARLELLKPKMDAFYAWCIEKRQEALASMTLHGALNYTIKQWPSLENALDDGRFPLENNRAENSLRPFCLGRKNWLFSDTPDGAHASAGIYSIVTTAKANGLKPQKYLTWLFETMPNTENIKDREVLAQFLPWSDKVPQSCYIDTDKAPESNDPINEPILDIDPLTFDED